VPGQQYLRDRSHGAPAQTGGVAKFAAHKIAVLDMEGQKGHVDEVRHVDRAQAV